MDYFFGVVQNKFYKKNPKTVNELKDFIGSAFTEFDIGRNLLNRVSERPGDV